jgi:hypothetical protein
MPIHIQTTCMYELAKIIHFLQGNNIEFTTDDNFLPLLTKLINMKLIHPSWMRGRFLPYIDEIKENISPSFLICVRGDYNEIKRFPNKHFKSILGPENLNSQGMISIKEAITFIYHQMKIKKIQHTPDVIQMDPFLHNLFSSTESSILVQDLPEMVETLFNPS